jgi:subtilase family serine protease
VLVDGFDGTPGEWQDEVTLDIELQIAVASGATKILVYEGPNTADGAVDTFNKIATDNLATEISASWGIDEPDCGQARMDTESSSFEEMAAQGQTIFASSGDNGAYGNGSRSSDGTLLCVQDPASQPYVTAVGGTTLATNGPGGAWQSERVWNATSAAGAWGATGGGISAFWPIPNYQHGVVTTASLGSTFMRNVPDVALDADLNTGYSIYFQGEWWYFGGTSCGTPIWAAYTALLNQECSALGEPPLGFLSPTLYSIGRGSAYDSSFHDIDSGGNNGYYPAVTGYDCTTGWGTITANLFSAIMGEVTPTAALTSVSPGSAAAGSAAITVTLAGTNFLKGVQAQWNGAALNTAYVSAAKATATVPATDLAKAGTYQIAMANPFAAASNTVTFTVSNPAVKTVSPASAAAGSADRSIVLTGEGFLAGSQVHWQLKPFSSLGSSAGVSGGGGQGRGGTLATTYISPTRLIATVPASDLKAAGRFAVTVVNPGPAVPTSNALTFVVSGP